MATANKDLSHYDTAKIPDGSSLKVGLVVSEWNSEITESLCDGAYSTLLDCGVKKDNIARWNVPGSFELPFGCKKMINALSVDAIIAIGSVIRGETSHFDYVCSATSQGIMDLNLQTQIPIIFCVLTDDTWQQSKDRSGGKLGNKGVEAAVTAIKMTHLGI